MKKLLIFIVCLFLLGACKTIEKTVEVPVEVIKKEYIHDTKIDSIIVRDSIDRFLKGDTFFIYKLQTKFKFTYKTDTIIRTDTIPKIITTTTVKEKKVNHLYWWQKILMWVGGITLLVFASKIIMNVKFK